MRIVISGSSGLIGSELVTRLRAERHDVIRLVRRPAGPDEHTWDPVAGQLEPAAIDGADAVINLAGAGIGDKRWTDSYKRELRESRVRTTDLLATTIATVERPPRVLLSGSAIGVYGARSDEVLDESSAPGTGFLADLCIEWEAATAPAEAAGVRVTHLRTGIVLARHGGALKKQLPLFRLGLGGRFGSGKQWQSWISLDDEVGAIVHLLSADVHGAVNLTAPSPVTGKEFTATLGRVLKRPAVPADPLVRTEVAAGRRAGRGAAPDGPAGATSGAAGLGLLVPAQRPRTGAPQRYSENDRSGAAVRSATRPKWSWSAPASPGWWRPENSIDGATRSSCSRRSDGVGGRVRTDVVDGFRLDRGFQVLLTGYPELAASSMCPHCGCSASNLARSCGSGTAATWWATRCGVPVGSRPRSPHRSAASATSCGWPGSACDWPVATRRPCFARRRPRRRPHCAPRGSRPTMIERFFRPLFGGIQLDPMLATSSRMFEIIFRTLSMGDSAVPALGMGELPAQLAAGLPPGCVHLGAAVAAVDGTSVNLADGRRIEGRSVIVATEGPVASALLGIPAVGSRAAGCVYFAAERAPIADKLVVLDGTGRGPGAQRGGDEQRVAGVRTARPAPDRGGAPRGRQKATWSRSPGASSAAGGGPRSTSGPT